MTQQWRPSKGPALRRYQREVFFDLLDALRTRRGETFTVMFPRQAGKNEVAAELLQALLRLQSEVGGSAIAAAPTLTPQGLISLERTRAALERTDRVGTGGATRVDGATISLGAATAHFLSASPSAHVAGHTASILLSGDEGQELDREWFERQFRPMAASTAANTVFFGTPWNGHTLLDEAVARNRERDTGPEEGRSLFHYEVSWEKVAESVAPYREFVLKERERLGAEDVYFRTQYGLQTVDGAGSLFTAAALAALEGTHQRQKEPRPHERYVAGLDLGGGGEHADRSVLTIARVCPGARCEVVDHASWRGIPLLDLDAKVLEKVRPWRLERLVVDSTGLGASSAEHLARELGSVTVEAFTFSGRSKSDLGQRLLGGATQRTLALYANDGSVDARICRAELRACGRTNHPGGRMQWGAAGGNDDYVVSLALALRAAEQAGEPRFATGRRRE
ncbi:MAG: hypothetical protein WED87_04875 [Dehalococcoidia bacterium]